MNIALWLLQVLLAAQFVFHGGLFLFPPAGLIETLNAQFSAQFRLFLGVAEVLGALGLILPGVTRILPWLTPLASLGLMIVAGSASVFHLSRGETSSAVTTAILFIFATFVAYMRWRVKPLPQRRTA